MQNLTLEIEKALPKLEPESARQFELAVRAMLSMARRKDDAGESDFDRMARAEQEMHEKTLREGRTFSGADRLTRDQIHDRNALR